ncbi:type III pantothenate kinase [Cyclobacterium jeungdonense]|uniref:Type III pantothenate kinase n=1 Tax=Cyclobacterium jeungdonense TaxID=708087 RepID=A0ABT8C783_9BACT|nr:type III pantothenate kinase [Cyclobacterium jeungdonense]MDN3687997.1 type III pantothenate kinase [Cyclobacterium jeungdonense]
MGFWKEMVPDRRHWVIDIGNTRIKLGIFNQGKLLESSTLADFASLVPKIKPGDRDKMLIASVTWTEEALREEIAYPFLFFDQHTPLPIRNEYQSPGTLGLDRLAAVMGARAFEPIGPVLCIDLGTCITYDFLDGENVYKGGAISPGLGLRSKAMNAYTARLPLVEVPQQTPPFLGKDTVGCIQSGIYYGILGEMKEYIHRFTAAYGQVNVFICGGDAEIFESLTKDHIFVIPNLVLYGLDRILTYNVEK